MPEVGGASHVPGSTRSLEPKLELPTIRGFSSAVILSESCTVTGVKAPALTDTAVAFA